MIHFKQIPTIILCMAGAWIWTADAQSLGSITHIPENMIESKWEHDSEGNRMLNYYNNDYCDYYLFRINDKSYTLKPGKNTVFTIRKDSNFDSQFKTAGSYYRFKGAFPKDFDIRTPYLLPVHNGEYVRWKTDRRERMKTMNFGLAPGDTVYACRLGTACEVNDSRSLLIYHQDHSFAAYMMMDECFILPGETVYPGMPVGIAGLSGVSVSFFFLDENKFGNSVPSTGSIYTHFIPYFSTSDGTLQPEEGLTYVAAAPDEIVMAEMTKREKKRYLKQFKDKPAYTEAEKPAPVETASELEGIEWLQDPVSEEEKNEIARFIGKEMDYFSSIGMKPYLDITIYNFEDPDAAKSFILEKFDRKPDGRTFGSIYFPKWKTGVVIGYDSRKPELNVDAINYLVNSNLYRNLSANVTISQWLSRGLSIFFENCGIDKDGALVHNLSARQRERLREYLNGKTPDIATFTDMSNAGFMKFQTESKGIAYVMAHVTISAIIENGHNNVITALLNRTREQKPSEIIEKTYPGGIAALEKDISDLIK